MRFRPCIDIHDGKVKQIVGKTLRDGADPVTNFESPHPPSYFAQIYKNDGLYGGHVIMLGKGNEEAAVGALKAFPGGMQVGGGITPQNASFFLDAGASHVIVTSYVFTQGEVHWERLSELERAVGRERLVVDLSCRRHRNGGYMVLSDRWQKETGVFLSLSLFKRLADHCDEFLVHAVHVEGLRGGIDRELVEFLSECTVKPITYAGGVGSLDDMELVENAGGGRIDVSAGSALDLFGGSMEYRKAVERFGGRSIVRVCEK